MQIRTVVQIVTILVIILVLEQVLIRTIYITHFQNNNQNILLSLFFTIITVISIIAQFLILRYLLTENYLQTRRKTTISVTILQSAIVTFVLILVLQMVPDIELHFDSVVNRNILLSSIISTSYVLATILLAVVAYKFFKLSTLNMKLIPVLYGIAFSTLVLNATLNLISTDIKLGRFMFLVIAAPESCRQFEAAPTCPELNFLLNLTLFISFLLLWASSTILLYRNRNTLGRKIWITMLMPLTLLIVPTSSFLLELALTSAVYIEAFLFFIIFEIAFYFLMWIIPALAFGATFWMLRKIVTDLKFKNSFLIGGIGLFSYLISINQSFVRTSNFVQDYVPIGILGLSLVGLFAFMISNVSIEDLKVKIS